MMSFVPMAEVNMMFMKSKHRQDVMMVLLFMVKHDVEVTLELKELVTILLLHDH